MSGRHILVANLIFGCLAGGLHGALASTYTEEQIELAGKIGAAVAHSRICSDTVPTTAVVDVLKANGLTEMDILEDTPIRERMVREASAVMKANMARRNNGEPQIEIVRAACHEFRASFGPGGLLVPITTD